MGGLRYMLENPEYPSSLIMEQCEGAENQQETFATKMGWLGGIVDGEGSISISWKKYHRGKKQGQYSLWVNIVNSDEKIINKVVEILNSINQSHHVRAKKRQSKRKTVYEVLVLGWRRNLHFLPLIIPYLVGKQDRAILAYRLCQSRVEKFETMRQEKKRMSPYTTDEIKIMQRIKDLNDSGRKRSQWLLNDYTRSISN